MVVNIDVNNSKNEIESNKDSPYSFLFISHGVGTVEPATPNEIPNAYNICKRDTENDKNFVYG